MSSRAELTMHTLHLGMSWFPEQAGGLPRVYYELLHHLPRCGVMVRGLVAGSPQVAQESGQRVRAFAPPTVPLMVRGRALRWELRRMLAEQRPDLMVSHFALYTFPVLDMIRPYPLAIHFHGPWAQESQVEIGRGSSIKIKAVIERAVYRRGASFIVLSRAFREVLHRSYGVPVERIWVIPAGIDVDRFATEVTRREARERLDWSRDRPIVLAVRRLTRRMGLENLIEAMKEVREKVPEALLLVAGQGPLAGTLAARADSLGLENNVRFLGFVSDEELPLAYRAADLTVVPTVALEGFGLITVESLAVGTPVLVTPVGGLPEVVRDLSPELVLPGTEAGPLGEGLVAALRGGLSLPDEEACRAYACARYDWPVVAAQVSEVYAEALR
jgi:glycogen synthase